MAATLQAHSPRLSAAERRESVLEAGVVEFATFGLHGASTEAIAERAGISQPYVFKLFGTKKDLFVACVDRVCDRIVATWEEAVEAGPDDRLVAMGEAYVGLMYRREELLLVLQAFAAAKDPDILEKGRERMRHMHEYVSRAARADPARVQAFFAQGMLLTVAAGLDLQAIGDTGWAAAFMRVDVGAA